MLAAGKGTRLRPLTDDRPKTMIKLNNQTLLDRQLERFHRFGIKDVAVVTGYCSDAVSSQFVFKAFENKDYNSTNMAYSLFCAKEFLEDDVIISYGDILYEDQVLDKLSKSEQDISVTVDLDWEKYYSQRFQNPYDDAESLIYDNNLKITDIGKSNPLPKEVMAQYIGLIKLSKAGARTFFVDI
ncbi:phosphocholine cytidylyltransferase family protein [Cohnella rhizosphaerae]|uniref:Phosphocholine cytidylyltransferase family protein n=1 Tax=Cohnella rhizosphaerae TaxID=1457232 RepID=A0A9X4QU52_9BACL|nr:phosphocholine cytidylyltransferase family protein [Cohnella rhizosphaerae]MDG0811901.1 phosphocholine cytidylyltransferase family protein [Cohnella rhizosphaerae]